MVLVHGRDSRGTSGICADTGDSARANLGKVKYKTSSQGNSRCSEDVVIREKKKKTKLDGRRLLEKQEKRAWIYHWA
jgi:hypothetical protein